MTDPVIHVGYYKTGTNWLQRKMFTNAALGYRRIHLQQDGFHLDHLNDFDFDPARCRAQMDPVIEECDRAGVIPVVSRPRLVGNPHAGSYDSRTLADRIAAVFPRARVLVVIREQRSMILSTYAQYVKAGGPCSLRAYLESPDDQRRPGFRFEQFRYDRLIAHYQHRFGRERVLVQAYEQLREAPDAFADAVAAFCGGKAPPPAAGSAVMNRGQGALGLSLLRWLNPFLKADSLNGWSPYALRPLHKPVRGLLMGIDAITPRALKDAISARWRDRIAAETLGRYEESNRATVGLTGIDLAHFGYRI